jgi:hypothetical protein
LLDPSLRKPDSDKFSKIFFQLSHNQTWITRFEAKLNWSRNFSGASFFRSSSAEAAKVPSWRLRQPFWWRFNQFSTACK